MIFIDYEIEEVKEIEGIDVEWRVMAKKKPEIELTKDLEIHIITLNRLKGDEEGKLGEKEKRLKKWVKFIKNPEEVGEREMEEAKEIKKAKEELEKINEDERERVLAELREKYVKDMMATEDYGYEHGKKEEKLEIAKKLLKQGIDVQIIMTATGLSKKEIEQLK